MKKTIIIAIHALVGWALCGATMGLGMKYTTLNNALAIHAVAAPIIFFFISLLYFKKFAYTGPLQTASIFTMIIIFMDVFVVALLIEKSFAMFKSIPGTWLPFGMIFVSTWITARGEREKVA